MGEVRAITYFTEPALLWLAGTVMGEDKAYKISHGVSITVVGRHVYGRSSGP